MFSIQRPITILPNSHTKTILTIFLSRIVSFILTIQLAFIHYRNSGKFTKILAAKNPTFYYIEMTPNLLHSLTHLFLVYSRMFHYDTLSSIMHVDLFQCLYLLSCMGLLMAWCFWQASLMYTYLPLMGWQFCEPLFNFLYLHSSDTFSLLELPRFTGVLSYLQHGAEQIVQASHAFLKCSR